MSKGYYLGLDNGGSITKVGLYDENGSEVVTASASSDFIYPKVGCVERDAEQLFQINIECIREVLTKSGVDAKNIRSVGITGHANGLYLVGPDGKPAANGISSTDFRADYLVRKWYQDGTYEKMLPKTSQQIWAGQLAPILSWFRHNEQAILDNSKYAFSNTDYIRFRLTGEAYGEISNMSCVSLMDNKNKCYDKDILEWMGIEEYERLLPPIRLSHEMCGSITREAAEMTGLVSGTPVAGGALDVGACMLATGVIKTHMLSITAGTWAMNSFISDTQIIDKDLFMVSIHPIKDHFLILEGSMTSASNLEWFVRDFMHEEKVEMEAVGKRVYDACNEMVAQTKPDSPPVIFLPYLFGTNANVNAKASFVGLNNTHSKKDMLRAIYEGVVLSAFTHIENLLRYKKDVTSVGRISGGPSNSEIWVQMFADVLQMPIEVAAAKELGTMGAAMCGAIACGDFSYYNDVVAAFVKVKYACEPIKENKDAYCKKYELYKSLVQSIDPFWEKLNNF